MDALVKGFARRREAESYWLIAFERGAAAAMNFGGGLPRYQAHFDGANYFLGVGRGDAGGGFGIETGQEAMEMGGAVKLRAGAQAVADFCGTFRSVGEAFEQGAEIEAGAGGDDGKFFAAAQIVQDFEGAATIFSGGENFVRVE